MTATDSLPWLLNMTTGLDYKKWQPGWTTEESEEERLPGSRLQDGLSELPKRSSTRVYQKTHGQKTSGLLEGRCVWVGSEFLAHFVFCADQWEDSIEEDKGEMKARQVTIGLLYVWNLHCADFSKCLMVTCLLIPGSNFYICSLQEIEGS